MTYKIILIGRKLNENALKRMEAPKKKGRFIMCGVKLEIITKYVYNPTIDNLRKYFDTIAVINIIATF